MEQWRTFNPWRWLYRSTYKNNEAQLCFSLHRLVWLASQLYSSITLLEARVSLRNELFALDILRFPLFSLRVTAAAFTSSTAVLLLTFPLRGSPQPINFHWSAHSVWQKVLVSFCRLGTCTGRPRGGQYHCLAKDPHWIKLITTPGNQILIFHVPVLHLTITVCTIFKISHQCLHPMFLTTFISTWLTVNTLFLWSFSLSLVGNRPKNKSKENQIDCG